MTSRPRTRVLLFTVLFAILAMMALASACGSNPATTGPGRDGGGEGGNVAPDGGNEDVANTDDGSADLLVPPNLPRPLAEDAMAPLRQSCTFEAGAWPAETLGNDFPIGSDIPINHIIVIMQENRSFDHYLGRLVAQGYYQAGDFTQPSDAGAPVDSGALDGATDAGDASDASDDAAVVDAAPPPAPDAAVPGSGFLSSTQLDVDPPGWGVPDSDGGLVHPHPDNEYCYGVGHSWQNQHDDWDNGKNDGFVQVNNPDGQRTMFYEDDTVIPFYYALANTFSVGDRYFCSVLSSTWPNRYFLMAATSYGIGDNSPCTLDTEDAGPGRTLAPQIFDLLVAGGHSWKDYTDGPHMEEFYPSFGFNPDTITNHYGTANCTLMTDIAKGTLPDVSFMMGDEVSETSDEGPSDLPGIGGTVVEKIIRALWASPSWKDTAVFITYDENGGIADHVPPAPACEPDSYPPHDGSNNPLPGKFNTTGFRVPFLVVSPYAKAHYASHVVHDHTSITRFIEARFGLPALTGRDANATPPMEMFDFKNPPFMTPPTVAATTVVPPAILTQCGQSLAPVACGQ